MIWIKGLSTVYTVCPRSSDPFDKVTDYIKGITLSWTHSILTRQGNYYKAIKCSRLFSLLCVDVSDEVQDADRHQERCGDQTWQDILRGIRQKMGETSWTYSKINSM